MLEYEPEKFPQSMRQGPKVVIPLRPPSSRHWNIECDLIFTIAVDTHRWWCEAKRTGQDHEQESVGAEESPRETPAPEGASLATASSSQAVSPMPGGGGFGGRTRCRRVHSRPPPPDDELHGKCEGDRTSGRPYPYGRVRQTRNHHVGRPHKKFISSTLGAGGLQRGSIGRPTQCPEPPSW